MAELGIIASVVQIADVGLRLSIKLYTFGEIVASADRSVISISKDVSLTSGVLKELGHILDKDKETRTFSENAVQTADGVVKECLEVFQEMESILVKKMPSLGGGGKEGRGGERAKRARVMLESLKWGYLQPKLQLLQSNLERLKSTLLLMLNVINYARQVSQKTESPSVIAEQRSLIEDLAESNQEYIRKFESLKLGFGGPAVDVDDASNIGIVTGEPSAVPKSLSEARARKLESTKFARDATPLQELTTKDLFPPKTQRILPRSLATLPNADINNIFTNKKVQTGIPMPPIQERGLPTTEAPMGLEQEVLFKQLEHYSMLIKNLLKEVDETQYKITFKSRLRMKGGIADLHEGERRELEKMWGCTALQSAEQRLDSLVEGTKKLPRMNGIATSDNSSHGSPYMYQRAHSTETPQVELQSFARSSGNWASLFDPNTIDHPAGATHSSSFASPESPVYNPSADPSSYPLVHQDRPSTSDQKPFKRLPATVADNPNVTTVIKRARTTSAAFKSREKRVERPEQVNTEAKALRKYWSGTLKRIRNPNFRDTDPHQKEDGRDGGAETPTQPQTPAVSDSTPHPSDVEPNIIALRSPRMRKAPGNDTAIPPLPSDGAQVETFRSQGTSLAVPDQLAPQQQNTGLIGVKDLDEQYTMPFNSDPNNPNIIEHFHRDSFNFEPWTLKDSDDIRIESKAKTEGLFAGLEGCVVTEGGMVQDEHGNNVGVLVDENPEKLVGRAVNEYGEIFSDYGVVVGRVEPLEEPEEVTLDVPSSEGKSLDRSTPRPAKKNHAVRTRPRAATLKAPRIRRPMSIVVPTSSARNTRPIITRASERVSSPTIAPRRDRRDDDYEIIPASSSTRRHNQHYCSCITMDPRETPFSAYSIGSSVRNSRNENDRDYNFEYAKAAPEPRYHSYPQRPRRHDYDSGRPTSMAVPEGHIPRSNRESGPPVSTRGFENIERSQSLTQAHHFKTDDWAPRDSGRDDYETSHHSEHTEAARKLRYNTLYRQRSWRQSYNNGQPTSVVIPEGLEQEEAPRWKSQVAADGRLSYLNLATGVSTNEDPSRRPTMVSVTDADRNVSIGVAQNNMAPCLRRSNSAPESEYRLSFNEHSKASDSGQGTSTNSSRIEESSAPVTERGTKTAVEDTSKQGSDVISSSGMKARTLRRKPVKNLALSPAPTAVPTNSVNEGVGDPQMAKKSENFRASMSGTEFNLPAAAETSSSFVHPPSSMYNPAASTQITNPAALNRPIVSNQLDQVVSSFMTRNFSPSASYLQSDAPTFDIQDRVMEESEQDDLKMADMEVVDRLVLLWTTVKPR